MKGVKLNTSEFIRRAIEKFGNRYDYSLVEYINICTNVKIICKEHGIFEQVPYSHLRTNGCSKCSGKMKLTTEEFIKKALVVHGTNYDYSLVEYINNLSNVKIICKEHGIFEPSPSNHLRGTGCPKCAGKMKLTTEEFIKRAAEVHSGRYDYSLTQYTNSYSKVKIICKEHGVFEQKSSHHLEGDGCVLCAREKRIKIITSNTAEFIEKANIVHNHRYGYELVEYVIGSEHVNIVCKKHGVFKQSPASHLSGSGCIKCAAELISRALSSNTAEFIEKANIVHSNKYDYSKVVYTKNRLKVNIICHKHGSFMQTAANHIDGSGCPKCKSSLGQAKVRRILKNLEVLHEEEYTFANCRNIRPLPFDFAIFINNRIACIEYQGGQHYFPCSFGSRKTTPINIQKNFEALQKRDAIKYQYCLDNDIPLLRLRYDEDRLMEEKIKAFIASISDQKT